MKQRAYRVSPKEENYIKTEIEKMMENGIIRPSNSPWSSPIVLVIKKDGKLRFCVNYQKLDEMTRKDAYPLPNIEEMTNTLGGNDQYLGRI